MVASWDSYFACSFFPNLPFFSIPASWWFIWENLPHFSSHFARKICHYISNEFSLINFTCYTINRKLINSSYNAKIKISRIVRSNRTNSWIKLNGFLALSYFVSYENITHNFLCRISNVWSTSKERICLLQGVCLSHIIVILKHFW